ncbi:acyl carrier protein [Marinicauda algicola]|uniref:Acyl carrier protein n=1 Tax=Marinicauda algicola TaxID=2029849 RepID=A0A4S2H3T9_9PROT|nr:acyl carrier protein [Marinicauda algicola]TGY90295.1 acyl carrier protein [Marinicauda algicola]
MTISRKNLIEKIKAEIADLSDVAAGNITQDTALIGDDAPIDSGALVELMLSLEEYLDEEHGIDFDWTSDQTLSSSRSAYRSIATLADVIVKSAQNQSEAAQ